jgi:signal transduction histidine kinase
MAIGMDRANTDRETRTPRWWFERLTIGATLYVGFGLVFVLWLASAYDLVRRLDEVESKAGAVSARAAVADERLSTVRVRVLVASVYLRDALFDTMPNAGTYYREQLVAARANIEEALRTYVPVGNLPDERESIRELRVELADFWETVLPVLEWDATRRSAEARALLRERVIPKREVINRIARRIQSLNRAAVAQEEDEVQRIYSSMRRRIWGTSGLAIIASLLVALAVTLRASRLEARIRHQLLKDAENTRNLQRLSAKLVNAQEDERRRIARELHDEVGQALTAVKVELSIAGKHAALTEREGAAFQEARRLTDWALQQLRDLSQLLHPAMLDDLGLPETIAWYLNGFSQRTGVRTDLVQDQMEERLAPGIETCLYRIVQEALTNVARHAQASHCRVYLQRLPHTVLLTVEDDGRGFTPDLTADGSHPRGLGLLGIEERILEFRGTLTLEAEPGKGTRLTVELPALPREPRAPEVELRAARGQSIPGEAS